MPWSVVDFGKHQGKTLPQIVFIDPDWFFWAIEESVFSTKGSLRDEAAAINLRARNIRIPKNKSGKLLAEYVIHQPTGKFSHMEIVPASRPNHEGSSPTFRKGLVDLSIPRQIARYDKLGCGQLISSAKFVLFGDKSTKMTRKRCESFFDTLENFEV